MKKDLNFCIQVLCLIFFFHLDDFTNLIYNMLSQTAVSTQLTGESIAVGGERQADREQRERKPS